MPNPDSERLIERYYEAFNNKDIDGFLSLLADDVVHDVNQGGREVGKQKFRAFLERMNRSYEEKIVDLFIMTNVDGSRAAAEFTVLGVYLESDEGLPPAEGQRYTLPAGAFFEIRGGKVARISNTYNLNDWIRQVGG
jgi:steroid delta-isomerase-like uncharacterized protein